MLQKKKMRKEQKAHQIAFERGYFKSLTRGGKMIIFKVVNLDSSIRIQTIHNGYLYDSPDQGLQSLGLGFLI